MLDTIHLTNANYFEPLCQHDYVLHDYSVIARKKIANCNLCALESCFSSVYDHTGKFAFALTSFTRPTVERSRDLVIVIFTLH